MTTTDIAVVNNQNNQIEFTHEQRALIKRTFAHGATDDEFALFMLTAERMGLRPEARQIHMVKRSAWDAQSRTYTEKMAIQTGIDGYRLIADRTGKYAPGKEPTFEYDEKDKLFSATAYVKKLVGSDWHECAATAHYDEYAQVKQDGSATSMWAKKPHIMLSKCAEALALRRAFPAELSGVYTDEEMGQADNPVVVVSATHKQAPAPAAPAAPARPAVGNSTHNRVNECIVLRDALLAKLTATNNGNTMSAQVKADFVAELATLVRNINTELGARQMQTMTHFEKAAEMWTACNFAIDLLIERDRNNNHAQVIEPASVA